MAKVIVVNQRVQRPRIEGIHHVPQRGDAKPLQFGQGRRWAGGRLAPNQQAIRKLDMAASSRVDAPLKHFIRAAGQGHRAQLVFPVASPCVFRTKSASDSDPTRHHFRFKSATHSNSKPPPSPIRFRNL
jgi:hypothetical protein